MPRSQKNIASRAAPEIPALTGLRWVAAFHVVLFHLPRVYSNKLIFQGYTSVSFFFLLSGFVLAHRYLGASPPVSAGKFWRARLARIVPAYLAAWALSAWVFNSFQRPAAEWGSTIFLVQAWSAAYATAVNFPSWSVSVEIFFYALFPLLAWLLGRTRSPGALAARATVSYLLVFAGPLWMIARHPYLKTATVFLETPAARTLKFNPAMHLGLFVLGMVTCLISRKLSSKDVLWGRVGTAALMAYVVLLVVPIGIPYVFLHNGVLAPLLCLVLLSASAPSLLNRFLGSRALVFLGQVSYSLYLFQAPIYRLMRNWLGEKNFPLLLVSYLCVLHVVAYLSFRFIEEPARRAFLRRRHLSKPEPRRKAA